MSLNSEYSYTEAFSRNFGWLELSEQFALRNKRIAIAGLGGVGGSHLLALARLGIEKFTIADLDYFDLANINRQAGAMVSTLDKDKVSVMTSMAKDINPNISIKQFNEGINAENIDSFLKDVDLVVDGLDLYAPKERRMLFAQSYEQKIPLVTAGPLGGGSAYLTFNETSPHPDDYFDFSDNQTDMDMMIHFLVGLAPKALQAKYIMAPELVSPHHGKLCSLSAGAYMASSIVATKALQILLKRGDISPAPRYNQFDGYLNKFTSGRLRKGNKGWIQKLKIELVKKAFLKMQKEYEPIIDNYLDDNKDKVANL